MYGFDTSDNKGLEFTWTSSEILGLFTSIGFILANGSARTFASKVSNEISVVQSVFYLNLFLCLFFSVVVIWEPIEYDFKNEWINYLGMGAGLYGYQLLFTDSMRREPDPSMISIIQTSLIIFTMMIDVFLMGSSINAYNIVGAIIVAITTILAMLGK
jgi:drug/metabolite transporter (DMT)-like permease